jgi:hypothetical protein
MPVLKREKHELFAQGLAKGLSQTKAALEAGYREKSAASTGSELAKKEDIKKRVQELIPRVSDMAAKTVGISKAWVIEELIQNIADARAEKQYGVVRACLVDIGKELRMFIERSEHTEIWNGDPATLTEGQLNNLIEKLETLAYGDDRAALERDKRRALREAGLISAASAEVVEVQAEQGDQNEPAGQTDTPEVENW